jgi:hypothetical protein
MICPKCGANNLEGAVVCAACNSPLTPPAYSQMDPGLPTGGAPMLVPNYLVFAILVTVFCCLPLGIPALVFSSQVNTKLSLGDHNGAIDASKKAKMWCMIAGISGFVVNGAVILFLLIMVFVGAASSH